MTAKELGEQMAFPLNEEGSVSVGMNLREYYAGLAIQGLLKSYFEVERWLNEDFARVSVEMADALLEELAKEE